MKRSVQKGGIDMRIILATHNRGKVREFQKLAGDTGLIIEHPGDFLPEPEETGDSFEDNALLKARAAAGYTGQSAMADDSGLAVHALDGKPGIYSARWAGPEKDFQAAMKRVHDALGDVEDRSAAFVAVLALVLPDGTEITQEGRVEGDIVWPPRGEGGFGYDAIFVPHGERRTFAEMPATDKQALSHRAGAWACLMTRLRDEGFL